MKSIRTVTFSTQLVQHSYNTRFNSSNDLTKDSNINIDRVSTFIDRDSKLKRMHCLFLTKKRFSFFLLYGLLNTDVHSLQLIPNTAIRNSVNIA